MTTETVAKTASVTGIAPQFLVDDLKAAIAYYRDKLGFDVDFCYESFYASVSRNGFAIHLKCAPKTVSDRVHRKQHDRVLDNGILGRLHEVCRRGRQSSRQKFSTGPSPRAERLASPG